MRSVAGGWPSWPGWAKSPGPNASRLRSGWRAGGSGRGWRICRSGAGNDAGKNSRKKTPPERGGLDVSVSGLLRDPGHVIHQEVSFRRWGHPIAEEQLRDAIVAIVENAVGLVVR